MKVLLLGLEFCIGNRGCEALAYSFVNILNRISEEKNIDIEYHALCYATEPTPKVPGTDVEIKCEKIRYKSPAFWKKTRRLCKECDLIFDFTMGDSFTDIYGVKRFFNATMIKQIAIWSKTPFILGPQTYGPFERGFIRNWAKRIIKKSAYVYTRDKKSQDFIKKISGRDINLTTDVAFALSRENHTEDIDHSKTCVGFNPSGLLWQGGYTKDNQFMLTVDYQEYCRRVIKYLTESGKYNVYLIPHVGQGPEIDGYENDYKVCLELQEEFADTEIIVGCPSAMDVKGYIAEMDVFIGARMHATIGAFSSMVPTIPFSYSRKFEGLYGNLNYPYVISAKEISTDEAVKNTIEWIENRDVLKKSVNESMLTVREMQNSFYDDICKMIIGLDI